MTARGVADDPSVATVGKMPLALREIPQSVSVTTRERIDQQNLFSLDEVMQQSAGVTVQPYVLLTTAYFVRGFKVDSFEFDGVPVVIGDMASAPQDISVYERVEILRGANGLLHGSGNPAATVNLVRKRPQYQFSANASVSVGSWDRYRAEADIGGPLNAAGTVRSRLVAAYEDRHFFYDHAKQDTRSIYGITEVDVTRDTLLTFGAQYQTTRSIPDMSGVPMARDGSSQPVALDVPRHCVGPLRLGHDARVRVGRAEARRRLEGEGQRRIPERALGPEVRGPFGAINPATGAGGALTGGAYQFSSYSRSIDANVQGPVHAFSHARFAVRRDLREQQQRADVGAVAGQRGRHAGERVPLEPEQRARAGRRPVPAVAAERHLAEGRVRPAASSSRNPSRSCSAGG